MVTHVFVQNCRVDLGGQLLMRARYPESVGGFSPTHLKHMRKPKLDHLPQVSG